MIRLSLALSTFGLLLISTAAYGQTNVRPNRAPTEITSPAQLNAQAIAALTRLDQYVIVHRSRGDFDESGKLARVTLSVFAQALHETEAELQPIIDETPASEFRSAITNALDSYRDGLYWWQQIDQPRVISVSALASDNRRRTAADVAFVSTIPYTVAIHWRHAHDYLKRAAHLNDQ